jgi:hypothetical protein
MSALAENMIGRSGYTTNGEKWTDITSVVYHLEKKNIYIYKEGILLKPNIYSAQTR